MVNTFSWSRRELVVIPPDGIVGPPAEKKRKELSSNLIQQSSDGVTLGTCLLQYFQLKEGNLSKFDKYYVEKSKDAMIIKTGLYLAISSLIGI